MRLQYCYGCQGLQIRNLWDTPIAQLGNGTAVPQPCFLPYYFTLPPLTPTLYPIHPPPCGKQGYAFDGAERYWWHPSFLPVPCFSLHVHICSLRGNQSTPLTAGNKAVCPAGKKKPKIAFIVTLLTVRNFLSTSALQSDISPFWEKKTFPWVKRVLFFVHSPSSFTLPFRRIQYSIPKGSSQPLYNYYVPIPRHHGRRNISTYTLARFSISKPADKYQFFFHCLCAFLSNWGKDNINQTSFTITPFSTFQNNIHFANRKAKRGCEADFKDRFSWLPWRIIPTFNRDNERPGRRSHLYADDTSN